MNERVTEFLKSIKKRIPENKQHIFLIIGAVLLLFLILLPEFSHTTSKSANSEEISSEDLQEKYIEQTESKLNDLISSINGAGKTKVMLTLECSEENIYAYDINKEETEYVVIKTDSGENGMLLKIIKPKIRGVAVVCEGGDIPSVKIDITNAVCTSLGIKSTKISISKMKNWSD